MSALADGTALRYLTKAADDGVCIIKIAAVSRHAEIVFSYSVQTGTPDIKKARTT